ncbi:MAG: thioredoxin fold domain-containing protein [Hydrogenophilales bacterium]|nr:thioredoxin fold domain-containing protein [Hydrogenophilales bacterium]
MRWLALVITLLCTPAWAEVRDAGNHFFQPKLGDLQGDLAAAKQEGKQGILLMFEMDDCPFCHRMKQTVLSQSEVQDYFRGHFIVYAMDTKGDTPMVDFKGKDTTEKAFALEQRARATPTFVFYDLEGNAITRYTGPTQTPAEFLLLGRYVVEGHHKSGPFSVFKRQAGAR